MHESWFILSVCPAGIWRSVIRSLRLLCLAERLCRASVLLLALSLL